MKWANHITLMIITNIQFGSRYNCVVMWLISGYFTFVVHVNYIVLVLSNYSSINVGHFSEQLFG